MRLATFAGSVVRTSTAALVDSMRTGLQSQVPPDFSIGYGTESEEEVFDVNGLLLALLLAAVALMTAYVIRRRRKAGKR